MNKTLENMSQYVSDDVKDCDRFLSHLIFAYNLSTHETTGYSPFFLLHGYEAVLMIDQALGLPSKHFETQFSFENFRYSPEARRIAADRITASQLKFEHHFNEKRKHITFNDVHLVYIRTPNRKPTKS